MARRRGVWVAMEGSAELDAALERVARSTRSEAAVGVLLDSAVSIRDAARDLAPERTGLLRASIFAARGRPGRDARGVSVLAGVSARAPHRALLEYGTAHMAARPYWRPAVRRQWPRERERIVSRLSRIILEAAR